MASIMSLLVTYAAYDHITDVGYILERFKTLRGNTLEAIDTQLKADFNARHSATNSDRRTDGNAYHAANRTLYQLIFGTMDESLKAMKHNAATKYFMDGLALVKATFDKYGSGTGARQLSKTVNIMDEKQSAEESPEEFATRMDEINSQLSPPIAQSLMCQFYIRGLRDMELKKYLIQQQLLKGANTLEGLSQLADEYEIHEVLATGAIDGMSAYTQQQRGVRGGRARGGRGGDGRGRGRSSTFTGICDFCKKPGHLYRMCRYLNKSLRFDSTTPDQHIQLDRKAEEFMKAASQRDTQKFQDHLNQQTEVGAAFAQQERIDEEFPNVAGQQAEVAPVTATPAKPARDTSVPYAFPYGRYLRSLLTMVIGLLISGSGIIILVGVLAQATPTDAVFAPMVDEPTSGPIVDIHVSVPDVAASLGGMATEKRVRFSADVDALESSLREGLPWDSCAGAFLSPHESCFVSWDKHPTEYRINGSVGHAKSQGTGHIRMGLKTNEHGNFFFDVPGVYVPSMKQPLVGAVDMSLAFGVKTIIDGKSSYIEIFPGLRVPLDVSRKNY
jgi:hypothetical protein